MADVDMRIAIEVATDEALEIADEIAAAAAAGRTGHHELELVRAYHAKRREIRLLRQERKAEVGG